MIVIVTEKPSVAKDIAIYLGAKKRLEGYYEGNGYQITWAFGHLIQLKDADEYDPSLKKWSLATLPFIPQPFQLKVIDDKGVRKQFAVIKKLLKSAKEYICATDAGREGELIFRYILSMAGCANKTWKRLWLSSLTDEALSKAFQNLRPGSDYDCLYAAAKCRSEADWIVGINATRNFTVRYGRGSTLWSIGRVQTPVLALIVKRDDEIRHFKSETYWELFTKFKEVTFKHKGGRYKEKIQAEQLLEALLNFPFTVQEIKAKKESEFSPLLYDLTDLQREMNRRFNISAAETLQIAQNLYEQKLITYPRTDSRYLSNDLKAQVVQTLTSLQQIKNKEIQALNLSHLPFSTRIINDKKVTDHHAIIPTGKMPGNLSIPAQNVYDAILTRLIAVFYPPCLKEATTISGSVDKDFFEAKGIKILDAGWTVLYPKKAETSSAKDTLLESQEIPNLAKGETGPHHPYIKEGKTTPPQSYTENTLLGAMETAGKFVEDESLKEALKEKGIGTPATRASIIETLLKRKYIQRKGKTLVAEDSGRYLIALIQDTHLKSAELTGSWEFKLREIEQHKGNPSAFMQEISSFISQVIHADHTRFNLDHAYGNCPKCKHPLIKGKKGYGCSKWKEGCNYVLWSSYKDITLTDEQAKTLLHGSVIHGIKPDTILSLSESGYVNEITFKPTPRKIYKKAK